MINHGYSEEERLLLTFIGIQFFKFLAYKSGECDPSTSKKINALLYTIGELHDESSTPEVKTIKEFNATQESKEFISRDEVISIMETLKTENQKLCSGDTLQLMERLISIGQDKSMQINYHECFMNQFHEDEIKFLKQIGEYIENAMSGANGHQNLETVLGYYHAINDTNLKKILERKELDAILTQIKKNTNRFNLREYITNYFKVTVRSLRTNILLYSNVKLDISNPITKTILLIGNPSTGKKTFINSLDMNLKYSLLYDAVTSDDEFTVICDTEFDLYINDEQDYMDVKWNPRNAPNDGKYQIKQDNLELNLRTITLPADDLLKDIDFDTIDHVLIFVKSSDNNLDEVLKRTVKVLDEKNCQIKFVITHAKGSDFNIGCSVALLNYCIEDLSNDIELKDSVYCVDNEGFRLLAACKTDPTVLSLIPDEVKQSNAHSWQQSRNSIFELLNELQLEDSS